MVCIVRTSSLCVFQETKDMVCYGRFGSSMERIFMQSGDEEAIVSSEDREVQGMVQIGREALLIGDNSNLYAFEGDIRKQLQQEEADWRAVQ
ncbi:hypothetical protein D5086_032951 [Populus alba]|uniref:Uncharacterized protein n=1 Tax=Populus alba TaxID=43335 RepID=A0ACC4AFH6_POPAL